MRATGADIRSVTSWSLFGAFDWNSLLTRNEGCYEPGAFDVRDVAPRLTAVGTAVRSLAVQGRFSHPVLVNSPGWWHRPERYYRRTDVMHNVGRDSKRPSLVFAGNNPEWIELCENAARRRGLEYVALPDNQFEARSSASLVSTLQQLHAWALIRLAAPGVSRESQQFLSHACCKAGTKLAVLSEGQAFEPSSKDPDRPGMAARCAVADNTSEPSAAPLIFRGAHNSIDALIDLMIDGEHGNWTYDCRTCTASRDPQDSLAP